MMGATLGSDDRPAPAPAAPSNGPRGVPWNLGGRTLRQILRRIWDQFQTHELLTRAAAVAFYAITALVPLLVLVLTISAQLLPDLSGLRGGGQGSGSLTVEELRATVRDFFPKEGADIIESEIARLQARPAVPLLSVGLVVTVWLASSLFLAIIDGLNRINGLVETRPIWRLRLEAAGLAIVQSAVLVASLATIVLGPAVLDRMGLDVPGTIAATLGQWAVVAAMVALSFAIALHFAPSRRRCWAWVTPGSLLGTIALLLASLGFRYYVQSWGRYSVTYGSLGGVVVLLGWMWLCAVVLFGAAVINAVLGEIRDPCR